MSRRYDRVAAWLLPRKRGAHVAVVLLTLLMIPGAMTALQPIDMESYEMESPELSAQTMVSEEFPNSEIILGFLVSARDPTLVPDEENWQPVPRMADGSPDYASLIHPSEMIPAGEPLSGIDDPTGGILNLTVLR